MGVTGDRDVEKNLFAIRGEETTSQGRSSASAYAWIYIHISVCVLASLPTGLTERLGWKRSQGGPARPRRRGGEDAAGPAQRSRDDGDGHGDGWALLRSLAALGARLGRARLRQLRATCPGEASCAGLSKAQILSQSEAALCACSGAVWGWAPPVCPDSSACPTPSEHIPVSACLGVSGEPRAVSLREHLTGCESWGLSWLCAHLLYSSFVLLTSHFSFSRLYILCIKMLP